MPLSKRQAVQPRSYFLAPFFVTRWVTFCFKVISVNKSTHHTGRIRMSHLGKSGLRSNRVSISCIAFLDSEMPFS